ncbi:MAG: hypothetical protein NZM43_06145 [Saprospiraceae bacterium]|nr:hypothetical protein [Saprospiraceae bacterium]MDW8483891.1 hypothetical protein [Saprospiraceae bacterium]
MQDLRELILLLAQHNIRPFKELNSAKDSKLLALYEGIAKGKYHSDEEAAADLYKDKSTSSSYRKLKSTLREKLLDCIFEINTQQETYSDYQRAYYDCHRQWVIVRFLTGQNANTVALILANKLLRTAERFDFTLLCMDIASYLRIQYGLRESNPKRFEEATQQFERFRKIYDAEALAEELYTSLVVRTVNNRSAQPEVATLAREYYERIRPHMEQYATYKLHLYGYLIGLTYYTAQHKYQEALDFCKEAIAFFQHRPYEARVPLQIFYYQQLICHIHLRQFEAGKEAARHCLRLMQEGTFNWFKYRELYLHLLLHTRRYEEAAQLLHQTLAHPRFEFLPENVAEIWRIYEAYIYFLYRAGKVVGTSKTKFKLAKFINEFSIFNKDRSGVNIAIIIVKWLLLILEKQFGRLLDEVESTEQYCYRHLRSENTKRSYYFMKMLLQVPLSQFERKIVEERSARFLKELQAVPIQMANQTHEIEIIPYEDLWEMVVEVLE